MPATWPTHLKLFFLRYSKMAGFIRALPPRLLFPRPVITEMALQPFLEWLPWGSGKEVNVQVFNEVLIILKLFYFIFFHFILFYLKKKNQKLKTKGTSTSILKIVNEPVWDKHKRLRLCFCECLSGLFHKWEETVLDKHKNFVALRMRMSPSNCAYHKAGASLCLSHKCEQLLLRASDRCAEGHATQNYSPMLETNWYHMTKLQNDNFSLYLRKSSQVF